MWIAHKEPLFFLKALHFEVHSQLAIIEKLTHHSLIKVMRSNRSRKGVPLLGPCLSFNTHLEHQKVVTFLLHVRILNKSSAFFFFFFANKNFLEKI